MGAGAVDVGRVHSRGGVESMAPDAGSGDPAYMGAGATDVGRAPSRGGVDDLADNQDDVGNMHEIAGHNDQSKPPPRRLRRLDRVWRDREGNISYLLTLCVEGRARVLANEPIFIRLTGFLLDSPRRYGWFPRRFVVMPDHLHLIAHQGIEAVTLGHWIKALKAVVGGFRSEEGGPGNARSGDRAYMKTDAGDVGRVTSRGGAEDKATDARSGDRAYRGADVGDAGRVPPRGGVECTAPDARSGDRAYMGTDAGDLAGRVPCLRRPGRQASRGDLVRMKRTWRWQAGFHDHKFRASESEQRKWEYVCLNPVRYGLVDRPEQWPFGGEIHFDEPDGPRLVRGTPPLLKKGILIKENESVSDRSKRSKK